MRDRYDNPLKIGDIVLFNKSGAWLEGTLVVGSSSPHKDCTVAYNGAHYFRLSGELWKKFPTLDKYGNSVAVGDLVIFESEVDSYSVGKIFRVFPGIRENSSSSVGISNEDGSHYVFTHQVVKKDSLC